MTSRRSFERGGILYAAAPGRHRATLCEPGKLQQMAVFGLRMNPRGTMVSIEMTSAQQSHALDPALVLSKALLRAADALAVPSHALARIIGSSEASISRVRTGGRLIAPDSKEGELTLLLLRVYRSLDALVGGNQEQARSWLHVHNAHLRGVPLERAQRVEGLVDVAEYLDALRGAF